MITLIAKNKIISFIRPKEKVQGVVYVEDVIQAFLLVMKKKKNDVYIISSENITFKNMIETIESILGVHRLKIHVPVPLVRILALIMRKNKKGIDLVIKNRIYDSSKIRKDLGFKPKVKFREGMRRTIDWYRLSGYL